MAHNRRFLELSHVSETPELCTSAMVIDETACEDTRIEAAHALATGAGKGEESISKTVGLLRLGLLVNSAGLEMIPVIEGLNRGLGAVGWQWESLPQSLHI